MNIQADRAHAAWITQLVRRCVVILTLGVLASGCAIDRSIVIAPGEPAKAVRVIDGNLDVESGGKVANVRVIDGDVRLHKDTAVAKAVTLIDGRLTMTHGTTVQKDVKTHYATVDIHGAEILGDLDTYCTGGEISHSKIHGDLIVRDRALWYVRCESRPTLSIGPGTEIENLIIHTADVNIQIDETARILGSIEGLN